MIHDEDMPLSALPYFLKISLSFCHALDESIDLYESDQDHATFSKVLDHLSSDLNYYLKIYHAWNKDPEAAAHQPELTRLGQQLEEAQSLFSSAVELIRH